MAPPADHSAAAVPAAPGRKPAWLRIAAPAPQQYRATAATLQDLHVSTICREARCPNKGECFAAGTASFLILGSVCTRHCRFCAVGTRAADEQPQSAAAELCPPDPDEPRHVAAAVAQLGLRHAVITSVTRDDLADGGAAHFVATMAALRRAAPGVTVELLISDLNGDAAALDAILAARPDVFAHNLETVRRLSARVRSRANYERSLALLRHAADWARGPAAAQSPQGPRPLVKTGLMLGLGERPEEVHAVLADCVAAGVDALTLGQYLQPRRECLPVARYVAPEEFARLRRDGERLGLSVQAGPFVRSSYRAGDLLGAGDPAGDGAPARV